MEEKGKNGNKGINLKRLAFSNIVSTLGKKCQKIEIVLQCSRVIAFDKLLTPLWKYSNIKKDIFNAIFKVSITFLSNNP